MNFETLISDGGAALAQSVLFVIALFFSGIGFLLMAGDRLSRGNSRPVRARIAAVRKSEEEGGMYYPVYEYTDANGMTVQADSDWGSSSLNSMKIGATVTIRIDPDRPTRARTSHGIVKIFGAAFLCGGVICGFKSVTAYPLTPASGVAFTLVAAVLVYKFRKILKPKHLRETRDEFAQRMDQKLEQERSQMALLDRHQAISEGARLYRHSGKFTALSMIVAFALLAIAWYTGERSLTFMRHGVATSGEFVRYIENKDYRDRQSTYSLVITYRDASGAVHTFTDSWSSAARPYTPGDSVPVLYLPDSSLAILDRGLINWGVPALVGLLGLATLLGSLSSWRRSQRL